MNKLPPEILTDIVTIACASHYPAVRPISLVSRLWNDVSRPFHFTSLAISGEYQLLKVGSYFESQCQQPGTSRGEGKTPLFAPAQHTRPPVGALFLSITEVQGTIPGPRWSIARKMLTPLSKSRGSKRRSHAYGDDSTDIGTLKSATMAILAALAPTLRLLVIRIDPLQFSRAIAEPFPLLNDLVLWGESQPICFAAESLPQLRRIHIVTRRVHAGDLWDWLASRIGEPGTSMTQMRLTHISSARLLSEMIQTQLHIASSGGPLAHARDLASKARLLPRLHRIYVQPWIPPRGNAMAMQAALMVAELLRIASADRDGKRFVLLEQTDYDGASAFEDWKDLLEGGPGPWIAVEGDRNKVSKLESKIHLCA
jgi:hypothetical protein